MSIKLAAGSARTPAAELHLRIPDAFVRHMRGRQWRALLVGYSALAALMCILACVLPREWRGKVSDSASVFVIVVIPNLLNMPWIGISSRSWEWYYGEYGISLRDLKNPVIFYGTVFISTKRDSIACVEQASWREYPALRISWRYGNGKIRSGLFVYRTEDSLVLDKLMPHLLAWPQNGRATA